MKVAIIFPSGHLTTTPCISSLAILLARKGIYVDVYTAKNISTTPRSSLSIFEGIDRLKLFTYPISSKSFWENIPFLLLGFFPWWIIKSLGKRYDFIIGAGVRALFIVGIISIFMRIKYIYLSLELYIKNEMDSIQGEIFKFLESYFNKRATFSIIQDEQRANILQRENKVKLDDTLIFPNSPMPLNKVNKNRAVSHLILKMFDKYGLKRKKVVLYSGSIFASWAMTDMLINEAMNWPNDWVLLVHSRAKSSKIKKIMSYESSQKNKKVIFSSEPLNEYEYGELLHSSHVGIALYNGNISENIYHVGYSSGKIAQYLKFGIPIIVSNLPLLKEITESYSCGFAINRIGEITNALNKIFNQYAYYSVCANKAFREIFNPEIYMQSLLKKLSSEMNL